MPLEPRKGNPNSSDRRRRPHHEPNQVTPSPARGISTEATTASSHRSTSLARKHLFHDTPSAKRGRYNESEHAKTSTPRSQKRLFVDRGNKKQRTSSSISISSSASIEWDLNSMSSLVAAASGGTLRASASRLNTSNSKVRRQSNVSAPRSCRFQQRFSSMDSLASCGSSVANEKKRKTLKSTNRKAVNTNKESRRGRPKKKPIRQKHGIFSKRPTKRGTTAAAVAASNTSISNNAPTTSLTGLIPEDLKELIRPRGAPRKLRSPKEILQECEINSRPQPREPRKPRSCKTKQNIDYNDERYDQNEFTDTIAIKELQISPRTAAKDWPNTGICQRNTMSTSTHRSATRENNCSSSSNDQAIGTIDKRRMTAKAAATSTAESLPLRRSPRSRSKQTDAAAATAPSSPRRTRRNRPNSLLEGKGHILLVSPSSSKTDYRQQQERMTENPVPKLRLRPRKALTDSGVERQFPSTISNQKESSSNSSSPASQQDSNSYREKQSNHFFQHDDRHNTKSTEQQQQQQQMLLVQRNGDDDNDRGHTNTKQKEKDPNPPIGTISIPRSPMAKNIRQNMQQEADDNVVETCQAKVDDGTSAASKIGATNSASSNGVTRLKDPPPATVDAAIPHAARTGYPTNAIEQTTQPAQSAHNVARTKETASAVAKKVVPAAAVAKKKSSNKHKKTNKILASPSLSRHKSVFKKATKTALKKATKKKKKKSRVRFAELPTTTTTYSIKVRVSTSSNIIDNSRKKKNKKKKHDEAEAAAANPLSQSEAHSIANQITQACIAQSQAKNNNFVVECDDDGSSSDEEMSSNESLNEEPIANGTANDGVGDVVHNDESVATSHADTSNDTSNMQNFQEQIKDGQADSDASAEQSARGNRTAIRDAAVRDGITSLTEEDQDKDDDDGDYVLDGRSVTSELSMSTAQPDSSRTNDIDAHTHEREMAAHEIEALAQQGEVVQKAKIPVRIEASQAEATFEAEILAKCSLEDQDDRKVLRSQQQVQDSTEGRGDTATDGTSNSETEQKRSTWHRSMRLRGGDSLAGTSSDSFRMSSNRARQDAASLSSSIRSKNRKGVSSEGSDAGSSRVGSKCATKSGSVCSSVRRKSRRLVCTESLVASLREEYGPQAESTKPPAPKIPMEVTVRGRSVESVSQIKTASDVSSESSPSKAAAKPPSTSESFPINSGHEADEISDDENYSMGSSSKSLTTEKSPCLPVHKEPSSESVGGDNSNLEVRPTALHTNQISKKRLPSRAAQYWIRKFEEKKARMKAAEKLKKIATVPLVTPTRKTGKRGRPSKCRKKKSPLHGMELPIPEDGSMQSFRQSQKALRQLMYYDEADQDWV